MEDVYQVTVKTYDDSAQDMSEFFQKVGSSTDDQSFYMEYAFKLAGMPRDARVVEVGCGDGRDAKELVTRAGWYQGFDPSVGLLDIAKKSLPGANFVVSDAQNYTFPNDLDIVFAFASLLHVPRVELTKVFGKVHAALKPGGVLFMTLKDGDKYKEVMQKDRFGERMFYHYSPSIIEKLAGMKFETVFLYKYEIGQIKWFAMGLRMTNGAG